MDRERIRWPLLVGIVSLVPIAAMAAAVVRTPPAHAQACPPRCPTPIITPAWHLHMCDESYQEQLDDNHCMHGDGVTEFPAGTDQVYIIYCHRAEDLVVVQIKDTGGGLQYVNHPDGITYTGDACETMVFAQRNGIAAAGSPYFTSAYWPEGPFSGVSRGIEWFIGLFVAFDQDNYYGSDAVAQITARDPAANLDISGYDEITVRVSSTSDPEGIEVVLREEAPSFPIFAADPPLRFSTLGSDQAERTIKVANRDVVTVSYCPRDCKTPYVDTATWYQIVATITPTALPTYAGPAPTATATPPPNIQVEYITLRPAPDDVGYVPEISVNRDLANHLGYPTIYSGMWTRGQNQHYGMVQFDLSVLPEGAQIRDARLEMIGRDKDFTDPGRWAVYLLDDSIDAGWRTATFADVSSTAPLIQVGPDLTDSNLAKLRANNFGLDPVALGHLNTRLAGTKKASFRVDGPDGEDDNLFGWHSGVDKYRRDSVPPDPALGPSLHLAYVLPGSVASPTADSGDPTASLTAPTDGPPATETPGGGAGTASPTITVPSRTETAQPSATATSPGPSSPTAGASASPSATTDGPSATMTAVSTGTSATATTLPSATSDGPPTPGPSSSATAVATQPDGSPTATGLASATTPAGTGTTPGSPGTPPTTAPGSGTPPATDTLPRTPPATVPGRPTLTPSPTPEGPRVGRQVCVVAFDDYDGDSHRDPEERFLPGVTIKLTHIASGAFVSWTTNGTNDPDYCWSGLTDGAYTLAVTAAPLGYQASGAYRYDFEVPFPGQHAYYGFALREPHVPTPTPYVTATALPTPSYTPSPSPTPSVTPTPTDQPTVEGPSGEICAAVFFDVNGDGRHDGPEVWLADVRVRLVDRSGVAVREVMTRDNGLVCSRLATGVYYARAEIAPGLVPSTTHDKAVLLTESQRQIIEFGQRPPVAGGQSFLPIAVR